MYNITLQQIEVFLNVAKTMNFSKAAGEMFISVSAASKMLQRFEEGIGIRLFVRDNKGASLTPKGAYLYQKLLAFYSGLDEAVESTKRMTETRTKPIRVMVPSSYDVSDNFSAIGKIVQAFEESHPDILLEIKFSRFREIRKAVEYRECDIIIVQDFVINNMKELSFKIVSDFNFYIAISADHPLLSDGELDIDNMDGQTVYCEGLSGRQGDAKAVIAQCRRIGFVPEAVEFVDNFHTLYHNVSLKKGIAICSRFKKIGKGVDVKYFSLKERGNKGFVVVAWLSQELPPEAQAFIQMIPGDERKIG
jgi:DNA-binding transcriptional LysR family regulator